MEACTLPKGAPGQASGLLVASRLALTSGSLIFSDFDFNHIL